MQKIMICKLLFQAFLAFCGIGHSSGQLLYQAKPSVEWEARVQSIRKGNGVYLSKNDEMLVSSTKLGFVNAFDTTVGTKLWSYSYTPKDSEKEYLSSDSGIVFSPNDDYLVFSVIVNEFSSNPMTRVIALSMLGEELWVSNPIEGVASGSPVISEDGNYVFLTHNSGNKTIGHFTILDGPSGEIFFSQENADAPFAPPGFHHAPAEGFYEGGENNRNDILVWSVQPKPEDLSVGPGSIFAFQFPIDFEGSNSTLKYNVLGDTVRDFQAIQKPVFANEGRSMYWGTSRSQFICWLGEEGRNRYRFNRGRTAAVGFSRGKPPMQAVFAPLAMTNSKEELHLFGGTASSEFVRLNANFSEELMVDTTALVTTEARLSPDDRYVYYVEFNGNIHQAGTEDLMDTWVHDIHVPVEGDSALAKDGTVLYVGDVSGEIHALRVANHPTLAPSAAPSELPTMSPSSTPSAPPSATPSKAPSSAPTVAETFQPTNVPTLKPTNAESLDILKTASDDTNEGDLSGAASAFVGICLFSFLFLAVVV